MNSSDDYDFSPTGSNNLRSLFDNPLEVSESSSLLYTAPKQPKPGISEVKTVEPAKQDLSVNCARVVQVWKLTDGKYVGQGKHGCAILCSSNQTLSEIILYKEPRNVIMRNKISPSFIVALQKEEFASFYDNNKENWLIKFSNNDDCMAIINYVEKFGGKITKEKNDEDKSDVSTAEEPVKNVDVSENKSRADILSRIAKMGQSILPNKNTEPEEDIVDTITPVESPELRKNKMEHVISESKQGQVSVLPPQNIIQSERPLQHASSTFIVSQPISYEPFNMYISENRTQNTEIRMNLSQISEKLNSIMKRVDTDKNNDSDSATLNSKIKVMELRIENLLKELSLVQEENAKFKLNLKEYDDNLKNKVDLKIVEEQKAAEILELQTEIIIHKNKSDDLVKEMEVKNDEIKKLKDQIELILSEELKWKTEIEKLEQTVSEMQNKLTESQKNISLSEEKKSDFTTLLKDEMNGMYANIMGNLNTEEDTAKLGGIIAQNIKFTTLKIIQNFQKLYEDETN